ncbi:TetR/AcrR family transcriptional regulator [Nigerium massiliense]|uniref:TetR/AcrR family transcriptional regulator n=1 Tax=Nigerium massiliense TaxID=1522317 RepID=UPI00058D4D7A|nr:TetR/AcrR family transcriptional regulator [Nigerium massiliense]
MPKITAPTVKEHREAVLTKLVDAAEEILRGDGKTPLTAGAVTSQAGIARNSIYRYVDSVDDLRGLVLQRYMPRWQSAVDAELEGVEDPRERVLVWVRANLRQASINGHGWMMQVAQSQRPFRAGATEAGKDGQDFLGDRLNDLIRDMPIQAELIRAVVEAGFRALDAGSSFEDVSHWAEVAVGALLPETASKVA